MRYFRPTSLVSVVALLYLGWVWLAFGTPLAWVTLGSNATELGLPIYTDEGYDGQFTYYIARDPLGATALIDVPAYRYQRILLPALGWLLSFGMDWLLPFAIVMVNLMALGVSTALLEKLLVAHKVSRWYTVGYALSLGVLGTVRLGLPEVLAYGLCIGGLWFLNRDRLPQSAVAFALAALARETTLLVSGAVGFHLLFFGAGSLASRLRRAVSFGIAVLLPFILLQIGLYLWLGSAGVGSGGAGASGFERIPLMGVVQIFTVGGPAVFGALMVVIGPFVLLPTAWGLWRCWRDWRTQEWTLMTSLLLFNAAIMLFVPFSTYREFVGILRFIVGLQLAVILYAAERSRRGTLRPLRYTTFWALTLVILIVSDAALSSP
jgi:hypothetical protein